MTRAIEQSLYAQMQAAQDLERTARETLSQAQSAFATARKAALQARAAWLNGFEQPERQHAAAMRSPVLGGVR